MSCRLVANAVDMTFSKGDAIAVDMPMTVNAIVIYFGIILAGCVVVSIADSFAAKEIATRLRVSNAKGIFTQVKYPSPVMELLIINTSSLSKMLSLLTSFSQHNTNLTIDFK